MIAEFVRSLQPAELHITKRWKCLLHVWIGLEQSEAECNGAQSIQSCDKNDAASIHMLGKKLPKKLHNFYLVYKFPRT